MSAHKDLVMARVLLEAEACYNALDSKIFGNANDQEDMKKLLELIQGIRAFEHIQTGWIRSFGLIVNHNLREKYLREEDNAVQKIEISPSAPIISKPFTQSDLTLEAIDTIKNSAKYAIHFAELLIKNIINPNGSYYSIALKYPELFEEVIKCADVTIKSASKTCDNTNKNTFNNPIYYLAQNLNGRLIPSNQNLDPLAGNESKDLGFTGACYGHVMKWRDEIASPHGNFLSQARHDTKTFIYQKNQTPIKREEKICKNHREIWSALDTLLLHINADYVYKFSFFSKGAHTMGLRKLPNGTIEFFDPNYGLFNFNDTQTFKLWCTELLSEYLFDSVNFKLTINAIGLQPTHSIETIPPLKTEEGIYIQGLPSQPDDFKSYFKYINHLALLASDTNIKKGIKIEKINEMQNEAIIIFESSVYTDLSKLKSDQNDLNPSIEDERNRKNQDYAILLRTRINTDIDKEITRLKNNIIGHSSNKIKALTLLKNDITNSQPSQSLTSTIETWLSQNNSQGMTHQKIINTGRIHSSQTKTYQFVLNLATNYEINVASMRLLQAQLLSNILKIIKLYNKQLSEKVITSIPSTFKDINNLIATKGDDIESYICQIQKRCSQNTIGLFGRLTNWRDRKVDTYYKILQRLDHNNPSSLIKATNKLNKLFDLMNLEYEKNQSLVKDIKSTITNSH